MIDYIGEHIELHRHGYGSYSALCPFHPDRATESLSVKEDYFNCFGCGASGDVINFQMLWSHQNFMEAVRELAKIAEIDFTGEIELYKIDPWIKAMKKLTSTQPLKIDPLITESTIQEWKKYQHGNVIKEGWKEETLKTFEIGYCIDLYDFEFYDRITFPIRDVDGKLTGVAGRKTDDSDEQRKKYRFPYGFDKSNYLYGLNLALPEIRKSRQMIITEGFHEVMRSWEAGVRNMVAICGSKIDNNGIQLRQVMKYSRDIILALDNDRAGIEGTEILGKALEKFCRVRVAVVQGAKDLGELRDYELIRKTVNNAKEFKDWLKLSEQKTVVDAL